MLWSRDLFPIHLAGAARRCPHGCVPSRSASSAVVLNSSSSPPAKAACASSRRTSCLNTGIRPSRHLQGYNPKENPAVLEGVLLESLHILSSSTVFGQLAVDVSLDFTSTWRNGVVRTSITWQARVSRFDAGRNRLRLVKKGKMDDMGCMGGSRWTLAGCVWKSVFPAAESPVQARWLPASAADSCGHVTLSDVEVCYEAFGKHGSGFRTP